MTDPRRHMTVSDIGVAPRPESSVRPKAGEAKVTGTGRFPADVRVAGTVHAAVLRSPHPHAVVRHVDVARAAAMPGAMAVLTRPMLGLDDKVRQVGDVVAAVAASSMEVARRAVGMLEPDYEVLTPVLDIATAVNGSSLLYPERGDNIALKVAGTSGDVDAAMATADHVVTLTFDSGRPTHVNLARRCCIATLLDDGTLEMLTSVDAPRFAQRELAEALGWDQARVRIVLPELLTSSFGGRSGISSQCEPIAARLAIALPGRPVRLEFRPEEELTVAHTRHATSTRIVLGATSQGVVTAMDIESIVDHGPFPSFVARIVLANLRDRPVAQYALPNYRFHGRAVLTNNPDAGEMRAIGSMQASYAASSAIDNLARSLGLDPVDVQRMNAAEPGVSGGAAQSIARCLREGAASFGWSEARAVPDPAAAVRRGIGVGVGHHTTGLGTFHGPDHAGARLTLSTAGRFSLSVGAPDSGQGAQTAYAMIAAEELRCGYDDVDLELVRSDRSPFDAWGSIASRGVYVVGAAVRAAAQRMRDAVVARAASAWSVPASALIWSGSELVHPSDPDRRFGFIDAADADGIVVEVEEEVSGTPPTFGAYFVEVEVDTGTGEVRVLRVVAALDVGRAVNRQQCAGQVEGAVGMGLEHVLGSEVELSQGAAVRTDLRDIRVLRAPDLPLVQVLLIESSDPTDPFGARGIGTPSITPVAPAVCSAIADALGVPVTRIPLSPHAVVALLETVDDHAR